MKKSIEMKKELDALKNEISTMQAAGKIAEAHAKLDALTSMKQAIEVQEALEVEEAEDFKAGTPTPVNEIPKSDEKVVRNRAFNKQILNLKLTESENKFAATAIVNEVGTPGQVGVTPGKGGYLLRQEQVNQLIEYRKNLKSLKTYADVIPVTARSGSLPTTIDDSSTLTNFDENPVGGIAKKDIDFSTLPYAVKDYGEIIPASLTLLADIDIDLIGLIGRRFTRKAVRTENTKILAILNALTPVAIDSYDDIKTALNVTLDPDVVDGSIILTNQNGFDYLDKLKDTNGHPLLQPVLGDATKKQISGIVIVPMSNAQLPNVSGKIPFFVGNMVEAIKFFDRQQVTVDSSTEAGFSTNTLLLRAIERFDVEAGDTTAVSYLQLTVA